MRDTEFRQKYEKVLNVARRVARERLLPHVGLGGDDSLEDLAQTILGTESLVEMLSATPFDETAYTEAIERAANDVGRLLFPDSRKRFMSSLDDLPEHLLIAAPNTGQEPEAAEVGVGRLLDTLKSADLDEELTDYLGRLADAMGVEFLTTGSAAAVRTRNVADRLRRLRRHYPDGHIPEPTMPDATRNLSPSAIESTARRVASGVAMAFPFGFFATQTDERVAISVRYMVENELRRTPEDLLNDGEPALLALGLGPALRRCGGSVNRLLGLAFPESIRPWMSSHVPQGYWDDEENRRDAVRWLVEDHLRVRPDGVAEAMHGSRLTKKEFSAAGLTWLLKNVYAWSVAAALSDAYPELAPWEVTRRPGKELWQGADGQRRATQAMRWALAREGLGPDDFRHRQAAATLRKGLKPWHLSGALSAGFDGDATAALCAVYPDCFEAWEITSLPREAWQDQATRVRAVRWLVARLGIPAVSIPEALNAGALSPADFRNSGMDGVLRACGSVCRAVEEAYPGRFDRWELGPVPRRYWTPGTVADAAGKVLDRCGLVPWKSWAALRDGTLSERVLTRMGLGSLLRDVYGGDACRLCGSDDLLKFRKRAEESILRHTGEERGSDGDLHRTWRRQLARRSPGRRFQTR